MAYELQFFEQFIHVYLPSVSLPLSDEAFHEQSSQLRSAAASVKSRMILHIFTLRRQSEVELYIEQHQNALIALSDSLLRYMDKQHISSIYRQTRGNHFINLCKLCYRALEEDLFFIETYFSKYFNQDVKLPEVHRLVASRGIKEKLPLLRAALETCGCSIDLINIALMPLEKFVASSGNDVSYRRLIWLKELMSELQQLTCGQEGGVDADEPLFRILCYLNLNSFRFYKWCVTVYEREIYTCDTPSGQREKINWYLKQLHQLQVKPCFGWRRHCSSVKEMLCGWLSEEQLFLELKQQNSKSAMADAPASRYKVATNISVPQLAYLTRLMVETGVLGGQNLSELVRFIAEHFMSLKTQDISPVSFRVKYYNADRGTTEAVRGLLLRMVHYSKRG